MKQNEISIKFESLVFVKGLHYERQKENNFGLLVIVFDWFQFIANTTDPSTLGRHFASCQASTVEMSIAACTFLLCTIGCETSPTQIVAFALCRKEEEEK